MTRLSSFVIPMQKKSQLGKLSACIFALILMMPLFMASCADNDLEPVYADLAISTKTLDLKSETTATFTIVNGSGEYVIKSNDENLATAKLQGNVVTVTTKKEEGEVTISVTDKKTSQRKKVTVKITVPIADLGVENKVAELNVYEKKTIKITTGSGFYSVETNEFLKGKIEKDVLTLEGLKAGRGKFIITDLKSNQKQEFEVKVMVKLIIKNKIKEITAGEIFKMFITSGSGNYTIETNEFLNATETNGTIIVLAVKPGAGKITITDNATQQTQEIDIQVLVKIPDLTIEDREGILIKIDGTETYKILTGSGEYEVESNEFVETTLGSDNIITVKGLQEGVGVVNIRDKKTEQLKQIYVSIIPKVQQAVVMETKKSKGDYIDVKVDADAKYRDAIWIDLNDNQKKDKGEGFSKYGEFLRFKVDAKKISVYGKVEYLTVPYGDLTYIDISGNQTLTTFYCYSSGLNSLDVTKNPNLKVLGCMGNNLTAIDLSNNPNLENLAIKSNKITSLDLSNCPNMKRVTASYNELVSVNFTNNKKLEKILIDHNKLTALDVSNLNYLTNINCASNQLTSLNIDGCISLVDLYCVDNKLTALNTSDNRNLEELSCYQNQITALDISNNKKLTYISIHSNQIKEQAMGDIVNALPTIKGFVAKFRVVYYKKSKRTNVCTKAQVDIASGKGWYVQDSSGNGYKGE